MADRPIDKPKLPFVSGLPAVVDKAEPKQYPCTGKLPIKKEVSYGTAKPR